MATHETEQWKGIVLKQVGTEQQQQQQQQLS